MSISIIVVLVYQEPIGSAAAAGFLLLSAPFYFLFYHSGNKPLQWILRAMGKEQPKSVELSDVNLDQYGGGFGDVELSDVALEKDLDDDETSDEGAIGNGENEAREGRVDVAPLDAVALDGL